MHDRPPAGDGPRTGGSSRLPAIPLLEVDPRPLRPVRVAVVGLGKMGVAHTAALSMIPGVEIVGLCDHHGALGKSLRGMGFAAPFFRSVEKMLAASDADAVWVCTQQSAHWPVARACMEAGAAVFVEKPLAHTLEDARRLGETAARLGRPLACGYTLAFLPVFAAAHQVLARGALGAPRRGSSSMFISQVFGPHKGWMGDPQRSGGGVVANISSHLLFLLRWYLGLPAHARATWQKLYGRVEDEIHGAFVYPDGLEVGFESSWSVSGYPLSAVVIEVEGENGKLLVSNDALELELHEARAGWPAGHTRLGNADLPQPARFDVNGEGYYLEDAHFLAWVTGGPSPAITADLALDVQRMMAGLYASAERGGPAVELPR